MKCFVNPATGEVVSSYADKAPVSCPGGLIEAIIPDDTAFIEVPIEHAPSILEEPEDAQLAAPPTVAELHLPVEVIRPACERLIEAKHTEALSSITRGASAEEIGTWLPKKQWATDALDPGAQGHTAAVAALAGMVPDVEAQAQGLGTALEKAQYLANRILSLASVYEAAIVQVEKARREAYVALAATPDDDAALFVLMATIKEAADTRLAQFKEAMGL